MFRIIDENDSGLGGSRENTDYTEILLAITVPRAEDNMLGNTRYSGNCACEREVIYSR